MTVGKFPAKGGGIVAKPPKPEKLVNQFFNKDLVNTKPKSAIKIGLISTKVKKGGDLETCPVSPPDGFNNRSEGMMMPLSHSPHPPGMMSYLHQYSVDLETGHGCYTLD